VVVGKRNFPAETGLEGETPGHEKYSIARKNNRLRREDMDERKVAFLGEGSTSGEGVLVVPRHPAHGKTITSAEEDVLPGNSDVRREIEDHLPDFLS